MIDERELVARCRKGDRDAQREIYVRTSERIYRLLLRMTRNADDAFDLAQETYLRAFARMAHFDGRSSLATWLYRIAVNEALQFLRRSERVRKNLQAEAVQNRTTDDGERIIARLDVEEALTTLSPDDRAILLLRYQEGQDYRQIAQVLQCAEGTVASRLNRARGRLAQLLGSDYASTEEVKVPVHLKDARNDVVKVRAAGRPAARDAS